MEDETQDERTERLFCLDDHGQCVGLSNRSQIVSKKKTTIKVGGKEVRGWIVTIKTPATDGLVRSDPYDPMSRPAVGGEE